MIAFAEKVLAYTAGLDQPAFVANTLVYDATLGNLEPCRCCVRCDCVRHDAGSRRPTGARESPYRAGSQTGSSMQRSSGDATQVVVLPGLVRFGPLGVRKIESSDVDGLMKAADQREPVLGDQADSLARSTAIARSARWPSCSLSRLSIRWHAGSSPRMPPCALSPVHRGLKPVYSVKIPSST